MTEWLDSLRSEGRLDSRGHFTLDPARSREMLARFVHQHPREHLQNLVSAAISRGANVWRLQIERGVAEIRFGGEPFAADDLRELFDRLLFEDSSSVRWLALGVLGAQREAERVVVESGGHRLILAAGRGILEACTAESGTLLRLHYRGNFWSRLFERTYALEREALRYCVFSPMSISVGGDFINERLGLPGLAPTVVEGATPPPSVVEATLRQSPGLWSFAFSLDSPAPAVWVLLSGVNRRTELVLPYRAYAVAACAEVALDVTMSHLQQSELDALRLRLVEELDQTLLELLRENVSGGWKLVVENWRDYPDDHLLMRTPLVPTMAGELHTLAMLRSASLVLLAPEGGPSEFRELPVYSGAMVAPLLSALHFSRLRQTGDGRWELEAPRGLPAEHYLIQDRFSLHPAYSGTRGLTRKREPARGVLGLEATLNGKGAQLRLPPGLHLLCDGEVPSQSELVPILAALYSMLAAGAFPLEITRYHLLGYLVWLTQMAQELDTTLCAYDALEQSGDTIALLARQSGIETLRHVPFLSDGRTLAQARSDWPRVHTSFVDEDRRVLDELFEGGKSP